MNTSSIIKVIALFLILGSLSSQGQTKKKLTPEERAAIEKVKMDSIAAVEASMAEVEAGKAQATADSIALFEAKYSNDVFYGLFNYKNTQSFTGYILTVSSPKNSYSDYSFVLEVTNPDNKYSIEGFAVKKEETVEFYYLKTKKGNFPLTAIVNKKKPLFSLNKMNDLVLTIWGQIKEEENIQVLFKR